VDLEKFWFALVLFGHSLFMVLILEARRKRGQYM
jgi:hypothetical protein